MAKAAVKEETSLKGKSALVAAVRESVEGMTIEASKAVVNAVYDQIQTSIVNDGEFYLDGIGTFRTSIRSARIGRNPATGEEIKVPAKTLLKFKQARGIKELLNSKKKK